MTQPNDPTAFFRDLLGQWDKFAGSATGPAANAQAGLAQIMQRALSAANMPSRAELEDLSARIGRIEAALFRIESTLAEDRTAARTGQTQPSTSSPDTLSHE